MKQTTRTYIFETETDLPESSENEAENIFMSNIQASSYTDDSSKIRDYAKGIFNWCVGKIFFNLFDENNSAIDYFNSILLCIIFYGSILIAITVFIRIYRYCRKSKNRRSSRSARNTRRDNEDREFPERRSSIQRAHCCNARIHICSHNEADRVNETLYREYLNTQMAVRDLRQSLYIHSRNCQQSQNATRNTNNNIEREAQNEVESEFRN